MPGREWSATKSGNGLQKTSNSFSIWLLVIYLLFFYLSVVLVVRKEKALEIKVFPGNRVGNGTATKQATHLSFSERQLYLLRDLRKPVGDIYRLVVAVRCCLFTLPALLSAESGEHPRIGEITPASNTLVHNLVDFPNFPLLRLVKGMVQSFLV